MVTQASVVGVPPALVTRLGSESGSMTVAIRRPAYLDLDRIDTMGSMYWDLYLSMSLGPSSPLEARAAQSRPGRS
jgi:hypothetical protein